MTSTKIKIDGKSYDIRIASLKRKADILDKFATRSEDGVLHREVIGTYYNYTLELYSNDKQVYNEVFEVLSNPVPSHRVELPTDHVAFDGYFSSISDEVVRIDTDGLTKYHKLTCRLTAVRPRKRGDGTRT